jgi:hypothetical protein
MELIFHGQMAERLIAAVLKTALAQANGGSNPSLSEKEESSFKRLVSYRK